MVRITELLSFLGIGKKKPSIEQAKLFLAGCSDDKVFFVNNGMTIKSLYELRDALVTMSDDTYNFHANEEKNDFSNWVEEVHKDADLAKRLQKAKNRGEAFKFVLERLNYLEKIVK